MTAADSEAMTRQAPDGTAYELAGPEGAPLVVLIHGLGLNRDLWTNHVPELAGTFRVLTYDLVGHADGPPLCRPLSLTSFSEQLVGLLDHLGEAQASLVGFSLGGMINRRVALDHPDRVAALAILNSPHERDPEAQRIVEERATRSIADGPGANLDETLERWFTPEFRAANPDAIEAIRRRILANDPESYGRCREVLAGGVTELIRPQPPVAKPALVMTCELDSGSTPAMSEAIASEIPGAELVIVPGLRHMGLAEQPKRFTDPIRGFLERTLR